MRSNLKKLLVLVVVVFMAAFFTVQVEAASVDISRDILLDETSISGDFEPASTEFLIAYLTTTGSPVPGSPSGLYDDSIPDPCYECTPGSD